MEVSYINNLIGIIAILLQITPNGCLKVSVYYEALCPDSKNFICRQLYPNYNKLKSHMDLELIPYGKASHNFYGDKWEFKCQHGVNECKGNKYQSCALKYYEGDIKSIAFINCVMREYQPHNIRKMENCANRFGLDWNKISTCGTTFEGDILLAANGNKTMNVNPNISFIPTIIYNDQYDEVSQDASLLDFTAVVCHKIQGNKPTICDNKTQRSYNFDFF